QVLEEVSTLSRKRIRPDSGLSIKPISVSGSERIVQFAFDYARQYGRKKVTLVHKANIMKHTDGLFLAVGREVAERNRDVECEDQHRVNPMTRMVAGVLMLRHLKETTAADVLEHAIADVIREGRAVTYDLKERRDDPTAVGTSQVAEALVEKLRAGA